MSDQENEGTQTSPNAPGVDTTPPDASPDVTTNPDAPDAQPANDEDDES